MTQHNVTEPPTLEELQEIVAGLLGTAPGTIPVDVNVVQLGLDSLGMMRVLNRLRRTGVRLSVRELAAEPTLAAWHRSVAGALTGQVEDNGG